MSHEDLESLVRRRPFTPFRVHLNTGETFDLHHPEFLMLGKRSAVIGLTSTPQETLYDRTTTVDLFQVVRVEAIEPSQAERNGQ